MIAWKNFDGGKLSINKTGDRNGCTSLMSLPICVVPCGTSIDRDINIENKILFQYIMTRHL